MTKLVSKAATARKRLLWHLRFMDKDAVAKTALARLEASMRHAGGFKEVLAVTEIEAVKEMGGIRKEWKSRETLEEEAKRKRRW